MAIENYRNLKNSHSLVSDGPNIDRTFSIFVALLALFTVHLAPFTAVYCARRDINQFFGAFVHC